MEDACFGIIPERGGLYYVSNDELLNGLVLRHTSVAVSAANRLHVAAALFGTTIVPSFLGHLGRENPREGRSFLKWDLFTEHLRKKMNFLSASDPFWLLPSSEGKRVEKQTGV